MLLNQRTAPRDAPAFVHRADADDALVAACLQGDEDAWTALIDRYKNLIYAVPLRSGLSPEDAADVFQAVCLQLFSELARLRNVTCLRSWLITIAIHKVGELRRQRRRPLESLDDPAGHIEDAIAVIPPDQVEELERDQRVRDAVGQLPDRCRTLVHLLFYEHPPRAYRDIARDLGLATGSIGFIRGRCLTRLARALAACGLK
jgi:RNA polymerase sigma factor (sigma-70 family)